MSGRHGARRWAGGAVALLAAALTLAGCAHAATPKPRHTVAEQPVAAQSSQQPAWNGITRQRVFAPYDATGALTVHSTDGGTGSCFATSIAVPLAGVYRCLAGNTLLDPCFAPAKETTPETVACFLSPWSDARVITVSGALPAFHPVLMTGNPWAVELANGVRCVAVTGAVPSYNDVDLTYRCDGQNMAGIDTDASGNITAHYGPTDGPLIDVGAVAAWRGRSYRISG